MWAEGSVRKFYEERGHTINVPPSLPYVIDNAINFADPNHVLTDNDIAHVNLGRNSFCETEIQDGEIKISLVGMTGVARVRANRLMFLNLTRFV